MLENRTLRGMRAPEGRSYRSLERDARIARRRVCPDLSDSVALPKGVSIFERLDEVFVGPEHAPTQLTGAVSVLPPGIEGEARYDPATGKIFVTLAESTYSELEIEDSRALFSTCHEIMHCFLHRMLLVQLSVLPHSKVALLRKDPHPVYYDTEWQADAGAAAMLMPATGLEAMRVRGLLDSGRVMNRFGVSRQAALVRIAVFEKHREDLLNA